MEDSGDRREALGPHVDGLSLAHDSAKRIEATVAHAREAAAQQLRSSGGYFSPPKRGVMRRPEHATGGHYKRSA